MAEGELRTSDTVARMPHFGCGTFDHSATSPEANSGKLRHTLGRGGNSFASAFSAKHIAKLRAEQRGVRLNLAQVSVVMFPGQRQRAKAWETSTA